jgi:hypothetical protein
MPFGCRQIALLAVLATAGCSAPIHTAKSPLLPAQMSPDSVVVEMFFVRFPFGEAATNDKLWREIDEQQLGPELRQRLAKNGFRVGVVNGPMPTELSKLMQLSEKPTPSAEMQEAPVDKIEAQPRVIRRHQQLPPGQRTEIIASGIYPQLPLLMCESGQLCGQMYDQAQGIFAAKSFPQPDGRVRLELAPELHYEQSRQRWVGNQGMLRLETGRPKRVFNDMTVSVNLEPGAMLILSSLPNRPGSLGHYFFTEDDGRLEQKLLLVRLTQTQHDGLFSPPEPLKLEQ